MKITCPYCSHDFDVVPRPDGWAGKFRLTVTCPQCRARFLWRFLTQGPKRHQEPVEAFRINAHAPVLIQEYDGTIENAKRFAKHLEAAWNRVPKIAQDSIIAMWRMQSGAPYIWLLEDRNEWGGAGWAAANEGTTLFVVDCVAEALPDSHLESLLIHEFGHFLFLAEGDEHHCTYTGPDRLLRCEKLVWDLTATWGVHTTEAELWMKRHFIDNTDTLRLRDTPLPLAEARREFDESRAPTLESMAAFEFPDKYRKFCI